MRCSWSEPLLDRYLEGTLAPRATIDLSAHLKTCANCVALLTELRVVDALLETTKTPDLPINFTFAVMADVRTTTAPRVRRIAWWLLPLAYLTLAWIVGLSLALGGDGATRAKLAQTLAPLANDGRVLLTAMDGITHTVGIGGPIAAGTGVAILIADVLALTAVFYFYRALRPRLAEQLARVPEDS